MTELSEKQRKLFEMRLKVNKARKLNQAEVIEEAQRKKEGTEGESRRSKAEYELEKKRERQELLEKGLDPEREHMLQVSANEAERFSRSKRKKESFGWQQYNSEAAFNAYEKRLKDIPFSPEEYEKQKKEKNEQEFFPDSNNLNYGQTGKVSEKSLQLMTDELEKTLEKRRKYSRRRAHVDDAYVTYINNRNKTFNQKISRAFDKYTVEIKQNLERGTAL